MFYTMFVNIILITYAVEVLVPFKILWWVLTTFSIVIVLLIYSFVTEKGLSPYFIAIGLALLISLISLILSDVE